MKAILVVDMPDGCEECRLYDTESLKCTALWKYYLIGEWTDECRTLLEDGQCPLKPMPEKNTWDITKNGHVTEYAEGWNACLEEIEK